MFTQCWPRDVSAVVRETEPNLIFVQQKIRIVCAAVKRQSTGMHLVSHGAEKILIDKTPLKMNILFIIIKLNNYLNFE